MKRQTFIRYSQMLLFCLAVAFFAAIFGIFQFAFDDAANKEASLSFDVPLGLTVVIDAGHGGEDGGAVGISGVYEKDINLEISSLLYDMFGLTQLDVVMTRDGDYLLYEAGQESRKKFNDLNNRINKCNSYDNPLLISIHQNRFPIEKYKGLQVWYSKNDPSSKALAESIQGKTAMYLQPENKRQTKQAGRNIFILHRAEFPAVLVECGFLSNAEEEKMLCDKDYQKRVAFLIFSSVMDYITSQPEMN